jgi:hypothetical protein
MSRRKKAAASIDSPARQVVTEIRKSARTLDLNEEIRRRAYEIYLERHGTAGDEHQDWLNAEREIRARHRQEFSA